VAGVVGILVKDDIVLGTAIHDEVLDGIFCLELLAKSATLFLVSQYEG
jgi:hypothetical protein